MFTVPYLHRILIIIGMGMGLLSHSKNSSAQAFLLPERQKREIIPFKLIKNLIVVPVYINESGPYNFVLDSGVGVLLVTDYQLSEQLQLENLRNIKITGLGNNPDLDAFVSPPLNLSLGKAHGNYIPAAILKNDVFNLSEYAGMPIHGLLGYEFFNSFIVRINYVDQHLTIYPFSEEYIPRKGQKIPISIEQRKPYLETKLVLNDGSEKRVKLIIDTGAGHPLSLENENGKPFQIPDENIAGNLGVGLGGPIEGYLGRIRSLNMGKYKLLGVISAFPNYEDLAAKLTLVERNGNLGNQLLKRFQVVFDYSRNSMYVKPSGFFKEKFEHDMSGLELVSAGPDYKRVIISRVAAGSPAELEGLESGDEIISINFKPVSEFSVNEIDNLFKSGNERSYLLSILPKNSDKTKKILFTLKRRI